MYWLRKCRAYQHGRRWLCVNVCAETYQLTPAYDLLNVAIANPKDKEELALSLSGKKAKLSLADFLNAAKTMGLEENVVRRLIAGLQKALPKWKQLIQDSFLSEEQKQAYEELVVSRLNRLEAGSPTCSRQEHSRASFIRVVPKFGHPPTFLRHSPTIVGGTSEEHRRNIGGMSDFRH